LLAAISPAPDAVGHGWAWTPYRQLWTFRVGLGPGTLVRGRIRDIG